MATEIQNFYKNKKVFLTGATGFLGKAFIEKLLRVTEVDRIYVMVRPKRGKDVQTRIEDIFKDPLFAKLHSIRSNPAKYVTAVAGDCEQNQLGLSDNDRNMLIEQVDIVVHSAATVRFNEPLSHALQVNVRATIDIIELAKNMRRLKAFVHVSSAFSNCFETHIDERFYNKEIDCTASKLCSVANLLEPAQLDAIAPAIHQQFPNTYSFTKALAEEAILAHASDLPVCVFRPGIIIPTCSEPVPGWIDNLYGPTSILYAVAFGVLRVMYARINSNANIVPVDFCANMIMASAWKTAITPREAQLPPTIYNLIPAKENSLSWAEYKRTIEQHGKHMPVSNMIWKPMLLITDSKLWYTVLCFWLHTVPGYLMDFVLLLQGKQRRLVKTYQKIHSSAKLLQYFVENEWLCSMQNTRDLWKSLTTADQRLFNFDMISINWTEYFYNSLVGMRLYLAKEQPTTIPKAKVLLRRLEFLHLILQLVFYGGIVFLICWCFKLF